MNSNKSFVSLKSVLKRLRNEKNLSIEEINSLIASTFDSYRDNQTVLHFESDKEALGPGRLVAYDIQKQLVSIQLRGDNRILKFSFGSINDFGIAEYDSPKTMGETLIGAFWEAKTTRRYLERIVANSYARLSPEEVDCFERISEVKEADVADIVPLQLSEDEVKKHICDIIGNPFAQKDWGGEVCDIFCNLLFRRKTVPAAFILKGKSYAHHPLRISDLGKNGDQLVRMFSLQAELFVIQSNGPIDGAVYNQIQAQVAEKLMTNQPVYYLILDGVQTARLLRAYGKI